MFFIITLPLIQGTFLVAGCLPDMAIFVDGRGSAARPPLTWSQHHPRSIVKMESSLVVIGEEKLFVFKWVCFVS